MRVRTGSAIRRRRMQQGLSQRELAFLARPCSQTTIYLLENQRMLTLTDGLAQRIARRLGVSIDVLFEDADASDGAVSDGAVSDGAASDGAEAIPLPEARARA